jgi:hypothetical protein
MKMSYRAGLAILFEHPEWQKQSGTAGPAFCA